MIRYKIECQTNDCDHDLIIPSNTSDSIELFAERRGWICRDIMPSESIEDYAPTRRSPQPTIFCPTCSYTTRRRQQIFVYRRMIERLQAEIDEISDKTVEEVGVIEMERLLMGTPNKHA